MRELAITNREDQYLIDADKEVAVSNWLKEVKNGADKVESFISSFPKDQFVEEYKEWKTNIAKDKLIFHIDVVESKLPLRFYFDACGLTNSRLLTKLNCLIDSKNEEISLKALNTAFRFKFPAEKPLRINPVQKNIFNIKSDKSKEKLVSDIMSKLGVKKSD